MKFTAIRTRLAALLPKIMLFLCLLQPFLDVLSFWQDELGLSNGLTTLLRFAMLAAVMLLPLYIEIIRDRKKKKQK